MAIKYQGSGAVSASDFKSVKWIGKTKSGKSITIKMPKAINKGDIDWTFADKGETVPQLTFEGVYSNTDEAATSTAEPWEIEIEGSSVETGAASIILGAGFFYIDDVKVALTRGGGNFKSGRVYRDINADGDRGSVEGRVVMDEARPTLTMNTLVILTQLESAYPAIVEV